MLRESCPAPLAEPACGCDGGVYPTPCDAWAVGVDLGANRCAGADSPAGRFPCGVSFCDPQMAYCWWGLGDTGDDRFECRPLPVGCDPAAPACPCLDGEGFSDTYCSIVDGNGVQGLLLKEPLV